MPVINMAYEEKFIRTFVCRSRRDRVRYELASKSARAECIRSFSACGRERFAAGKLHKLPEHAHIRDVLATAASMGHPANTMMYILHFNPAYDGACMPFERAMEELWCSGPCIMCSTDGQFAFCLLESGVSAWDKALLY